MSRPSAQYPHFPPPPPFSDNYIETIHAGLDFEVNAPYLMYTHGNSEVWGNVGWGGGDEGTSTLDSTLRSTRPA